MASGWAWGAQWEEKKEMNSTYDLCILYNLDNTYIYIYIYFIFVYIYIYIHMIYIYICR